MSRSKILGPQFSIITPILNGSKYIDRFLNCLLNQSYSNWEAIIVDDGSTDGSYLQLKDSTCLDKRFHILKNDMPRLLSGPYQARNKGLLAANGKYICFLDIDDIWLPNKLAQQANQLNVFPSTRLIYSTYIRAVEGSQKGKPRKSLKWLTPHSWIKLINPIPMLTACVHHETIEGLQFQPIYHEDYYFWHCVLNRLKPDQINVHPLPLAVYSIRSISQSSNKLKAIRWIAKCYKKFGYPWPLVAIAIIARGALQVIIKATEFLEKPINVSWQGRIEMQNKYEE